MAKRRTPAFQSNPFAEAGIVVNQHLEDKLRMIQSLAIGIRNDRYLAEYDGPEREIDVLERRANELVREVREAVKANRAEDAANAAVLVGMCGERMLRAIRKPGAWLSVTARRNEQIAADVEALIQSEPDKNAKVHYATVAKKFGLSVRSVQTALNRKAKRQTKTRNKAQS